MLKTVKGLLFAVALTGLMRVNVMAQLPDASVNSIMVDDHQGNAYPMYFGNNNNATYCVDDGTNGTANLRESIAPPPPPSGFDTRWKGVRTTAGNACIVDGLFPRDIRALPVNALQRDTFLLTFINTDIVDSAFYFSWDTAALALRCDSCFFQYTDPDSTPVTQRVNMLTHSSWVIPAAVNSDPDFPRNITSARIYKFGTKIIDAVKDHPVAHPGEFSLQPNYPNPFNPSTNLEFDIPKNSTVDVSIFNVLGQKIATLVTGQVAAGAHTALWNGTTQNGMPVTSGVYFARMTARADGTGEVFTGLRKLLLMK